MSLSGRSGKVLLAIGVSVGIAATGGVASATAAQEPQPATAAASTPPGVSVFTAGTDGYTCFRIPSITRTTDGTLLAFAEGRVDSCADTGNIDVVMRRSTDGGRTWGPLQVVWDDGSAKAGNPVPVVDARTGDVLLLVIQTGAGVTNADVVDGTATWEQSMRPFVLRSSDDGSTWTAPRDITDSVKKRTWRHFVFGPGHAIQLLTGPHRGRLVVPGDHTAAPPAGSSDVGSEAKYNGNQLVYSDDDGASWHLGADDENYDGVVNGNEATATELGDSVVYLASRDQNGTADGNRAYALSYDGGETFAGPLQTIPQLVTPVIQGSVITFACNVGGHQAQPGDTLVFSSPNDPSVRRNMSLWTSTDDGRTWGSPAPVWNGPSGYSDLVQLGPARAGLLYEAGTSSPTDGVWFQPFSVSSPQGVVSGCETANASS